MFPKLPWIPVAILIVVDMEFSNDNTVLLELLVNVILEEAKSKGEIGPNLDLLKPKIEKIVYTVTNGVGVMPMFEGILTSEEIEAVAYFVFNSTNN